MCASASLLLGVRHSKRKDASESMGAGILGALGAENDDHYPNVSELETHGPLSKRYRRDSIKIGCVLIGGSPGKVFTPHGSRFFSLSSRSSHPGVAVKPMMMLSVMGLP